MEAGTEGLRKQLWTETEKALRAADGAIGSHARLVQICYEDFERLARRVLDAMGSL